MTDSADSSGSRPFPARILDGRQIAEDLLDSLKVRVDARLAQGLPRLASSCWRFSRLP